MLYINNNRSRSRNNNPDTSFRVQYSCWLPLNWTSCTPILRLPSNRSTTVNYRPPKPRSVRTSRPWRLNRRTFRPCLRRPKLALITAVVGQEVVVGERVLEGAAGHSMAERIGVERAEEEVATEEKVAGVA